MFPLARRRKAEGPMSRNRGKSTVRTIGGISRTVLGVFPPLTRMVGFVSAVAAGGAAMQAGTIRRAAAAASAQTQPAGEQPAAQAAPTAQAPASPDAPPAEPAEEKVTEPQPPPAPKPVSAPVNGSSSTAVTTKVESDPILFPTVPVEGRADAYRSDASKLDRVPTALVDTPQTVAVVPEQVMEEQRATTVRDALRNVSGITLSAGEGGRQGDTFILRGFSGQNDVFRDGSRDLGWFTRDTFNLEGVEVFFGPSSVLFGRGSTGGAVNLVTKAPRRGNFAEASLIAATAPQGRLEADVNRAVSDRLQLRVNAMGQMGRVAGRDVVEENRAGFAPSVRLGVGEKTWLTLDYLYQRERGVPDYGQPFFDGAPVSQSLGVSRRTFYGVEGVDKEEVDAHVASARVEHDFGGGVRLSNATRVGAVDRFARPTAPSLAATMDPNIVGRSRFETETDNLNMSNQTDLRLVLATGFLQHAANFGVELAREGREQLRHNYQVAGAMGGAQNLSGDLRNPDLNPNLAAFSRVFGSSSDSLLLSAAVYAADQIRLGQYLELLGSFRLDGFGADYLATNAMGAVTKLHSRDILVNWRGGLVLHPLAATSLYGMVGSSSNPSAEGATLSEATYSLDPEKNLVAEVGAKADLLESRLSLGGSVFRIEKSNARVPGADPMGPAQVLAGKQRVQGFNAGASGAVFEIWKLFGSYTYLKSQIREHTNAFLIGQALPSTPEHSLSLWTTVSIFDRLVLGGGAIYQAEMAVNNPANEMALLNEVPSFWRLDAFGSYAFDKLDVQLNVNNLTNALYFEQTSGSRAVPGRALMAMLSTRIRY
jgi:catecholate siderophore receptor